MNTLLHWRDQPETLVLWQWELFSCQWKCHTCTRWLLKIRTDAFNSSFRLVTVEIWPMEVFFDSSTFTLGTRKAFVVTISSRQQSTIFEYHSLSKEKGRFKRLWWISYCGPFSWRCRMWGIPSRYIDKVSSTVTTFVIHFPCIGWTTAPSVSRCLIGYTVRLSQSLPIPPLQKECTADSTLNFSTNLPSYSPKEVE